MTVLNNRIKELAHASKLNKLELPFVKTGRTLLAPGTWNDVYYSPEVVRQLFDNTIWDEQARSIFYDHKDDSAQNWVGMVENVRMMGDKIVGDANFLDENAARKLAWGAKFGLSVKCSGEDEDGRMTAGGKIHNNSLVFNPACKMAYLNKKGAKKYEILVEELVDVEEGYDYFVDSSGSVCRTINNGGNTMTKKDKKLEEDTPAQEPTKDPKPEPVAEPAPAEPAPAEPSPAEAVLSKESLSEIVTAVVKELKKDADPTTPPATDVADVDTETDKGLSTDDTNLVVHNSEFVKNKLSEGWDYPKIIHALRAEEKKSNDNSNEVAALKEELRELREKVDHPIAHELKQSEAHTQPDEDTALLNYVKSGKGGVFG